MIFDQWYKYDARCQICTTVEMFRLTCVILALVAAAYGANVNKIVGGSDAAEGQFPYQVSLRSRNSHFCGGSILNERWILTAAHCLDGFSASSITVVVGTNTLNSGGDTYQAKTLIMHPNYNSWTISNDVGLIELRSDITFGDKVAAVALPTEDFTKADYPAVLSGWGLTSYPGTIPNTLQHINLKVIDHNVCKAASFLVSNSNVCTLTVAGEGACSGDSGGPLVADNIQIGIVSWGNPCALGRPDVYARVYSFLDWINGYVN